MISGQYFHDNRNRMLVIAAAMLVGALLYFMIAPQAPMGEGKIDNAVFDDIQLKAAYTPDGVVKVFALAKNNELRSLDTMMGNSIPESDSMVIGYDEAMMMVDERLFEDAGDSIPDLFGIDTRVEGVLKPTGTIADDFHFLSAPQYAQLSGNPAQLKVMFNEDVPKLFYTYDAENPSVDIALSEGNMRLFYTHVIDNKVYYPVIIGAKEAKMMREEGLFNKTGDTIDGFFGKDVIIIGITKQGGTAMDMMHIVSPQFYEDPARTQVVLE